MHNIVGKVIRGIKRGRILGFPTANIRTEENIGPGIYAGYIFINEKRYDAAIYCPGEKIIEAFVLNFSGDLYEKKVRIKIIKKLRDKKDFKSIKDAKKQIAEDVIAAKQCLQTL